MINKIKETKTMPSHVDDVRKTLVRLSNDVTSLDMLLEFERTLDNVHLYVYENWDKGEIVEGPSITKYWFTCTLMYPHSLKPDMDGIKRLEKYGCKVAVKEDIFNSPVSIRSNDDYRDQQSKKAKIKKHKVWLITINMPRKFIDEQIEDFVIGMNNVGVDTDDVSAAYDKDVTNQDELDLGGLGDEGGAEQPKQ